jgi:hypothetical protein
LISKENIDYLFPLVEKEDSRENSNCDPQTAARILDHNLRYALIFIDSRNGMSKISPQEEELDDGLRDTDKSSDEEKYREKYVESTCIR